MKAILSLLFSFTSLFTIAQTELTATRINSPIVIDGDLADWLNVPRQTDLDTKLIYSIAVSDNNLHILMIAIDRQTQMRILRSGTEIWIDTMGRMKKQVGIEFPVEKSGANKMEQQLQGANPQEIRNKMLEQANEMIVKGFYFSPKKSTLPLQNDYGIQLALGWVENFLVYEASIPMNGFYNSFQNGKNTTIGMTLILKALQMPSAGSAGGGAGRPSGGGSGGGRAGAGRPAGNMNFDASVFEAKEIVIKVRLDK